MEAMENASTLAAWYADPSGRHEYRFWSGTAWTEQVADHGRQSVDPLPSVPISGNISFHPRTLDPKAEREAKSEVERAEREAKNQTKIAERQAKIADRQAKADVKVAREAEKRAKAQADYIAGLPGRLQAIAMRLGIKVKGGFVHRGMFGSLAWPAVGSQAELYTEDGRGNRVTLTRVALTGIFALGLQKKTGKLLVNVMISGDGWSVGGRTENVELAHTFVAEWNSLYGSETVVREKS